MSVEEAIKAERSTEEVGRFGSVKMDVTFCVPRQEVSEMEAVEGYELNALMRVEKVGAST